MSTCIVGSQPSPSFAVYILMNNNSGCQWGDGGPLSANGRTDHVHIISHLMVARLPTMCAITYNSNFVTNTINYAYILFLLPSAQTSIFVRSQIIYRCLYISVALTLKNNIECFLRVSKAQGIRFININDVETYRFNVLFLYTQVWFQNRRSKERRMKQLSALGARRAFFRNPRRMRGLGDDADLMGGPGFAYFGKLLTYVGKQMFKRRNAQLSAYHVMFSTL